MIIKTGSCDNVDYKIVICCRSTVYSYHNILGGPHLDMLNVHTIRFQNKEECSLCLNIAKIVAL